VGLLAGHQEGGGVSAGVQGVGGHDHSGKVHAGQQVDLPAVAGTAGAAQGLAVGRDRPPRTSTGAGAGTVAGSQPGAKHPGQRHRVHAGHGPAEGGLGRHHPGAGVGPPGAERGPHRLRGVGGPLGDRGQRPGPGQHRGSGQGKDAGQRVAAAGAPPGVGDGGQAGEQGGALAGRVVAA
jgi:hypothetical protein